MAFKYTICPDCKAIGEDGKIQHVLFCPRLKHD